MPSHYPLSIRFRKFLLNKKNKATKMEVHSHTHTADPDIQRGKKKWTHYLWEFLMLFLAVFCGFLAENLREHKVEQQRAKELAKNLYKEIYADSIVVQQKLNVRNKKEEKCTY